jgi:outer membrane protein
MKNKTITVGVATILILISHISLKGQEILSLPKAIEIGLENNYEIRIVRNDVEKLSNNYAYGKYQFLPGISAEASQNFDVENIEQQRDPANPPIVNRNARSNQFTASVNLQWTIFDGMRMFISYKMLQELEEMGNLNLRATITSKIADISRGYYLIVLQKEKIAVLENTVDLSEKRYEIAKAAYEVGRSSKLEYLSAQVDLNADRAALIAQEEAYQNAKIELNRIMGVKVDYDFEVSDAITFSQDLDLAMLEESMLEHNPDLLALQQNQHVSELQISSIRAERYPRLSINAGYRYRNSETQLGFATTDVRDGYYYGLRGTLPILNGMDIGRRTQNAKIDLETTEVLYHQLQADLMAYLNNRYLAYKNGLKLFQLESENLAIAKENESIAYERYRLGNTNFLELREAQKNAVEAESRLLDAAYNIKVAEIDLNRLSGLSLETIGETE